MAMGKHYCTKPKTSPTYDPKWSGFSRAPHAPYVHKCGERLHDEDSILYCPKCDEQVGEIDEPRDTLYRKGIMYDPV